METRVLDRELYDEALAARVVRVPRSTLHWWLEGGERRGRHYDPVLRSEPTGSTTVTWGEVVEARYLRAYRRVHNVHLSRLRAFIGLLRDEIGVPYPLAHAKPWVADRRLFVDAQNASELPPELWACMEPTTGVTLLTHPAGLFLERVEFADDENGEATRLWPRGRDSPVYVDPDVRFGSPAVRGIPTETIAEHVRGGDVIESVAEDFGLDLDTVIAALDYEGIGRAKVAS